MVAVGAGKWCGERSIARVARDFDLTETNVRIWAKEVTRLITVNALHLNGEELAGITTRHVWASRESGLLRSDYERGSMTKTKRHPTSGRSQSPRLSVESAGTRTRFGRLVSGVKFPRRVRSGDDRVASVKRPERWLDERT
jgi:hypothetical protein